MKGGVSDHEKQRFTVGSAQVHYIRENEIIRMSDFSFTLFRPNWHWQTHKTQNIQCLVV